MVSLAGCTEKECNDLVCSDDIQGIAVDDQNLYWQSGAGLWSMPKVGGPRRQIARAPRTTSGSDRVLSMGGRIVWSVGGDIVLVSTSGVSTLVTRVGPAFQCGPSVCYESDFTLNLLALENGTSIEVASLPGHTIESDIIGNETFAFWLGDLSATPVGISLMRLPLLPGSTPTELWRDTRPAPGSPAIAIDSQFVYFERQGTVARISLSSGAPPEDWLSRPAGVAEMLADDVLGLLWTEYCGSPPSACIQQLHSGVQTTLVREGADSGAIRALTHDGARVYYTMDRCLSVPSCDSARWVIRRADVIQ
jgi:hypothetical protein